MFRKNDSSIVILRKLREKGKLSKGSEGFYSVDRSAEGFKVRIKGSNGRGKVILEEGWGV